MQVRRLAAGTAGVANAAEQLSSRDRQSGAHARRDRLQVRAVVTNTIDPHHGNRDAASVGSHVGRRVPPVGIADFVHPTGDRGHDAAAGRCKNVRRRVVVVAVTVGRRAALDRERVRPLA